MSVKQVDGEGGDAQACGPIGTGLCSDLETSASSQWGLELSRPEGPLGTPPSTSSLYGSENRGPEKGREKVQVFRAPLKSRKIVYRKVGTECWDPYCPSDFPLLLSIRSFL